MHSRRKAATKKQKERMAKVARSGCLACAKCRASTGLRVEVHHLLEGGQRRGHDFTIGLCAWHHRGEPIQHWTKSDMRKIWGPSVACGTRLFRERFGTDDALLEEQNQLLKGWK